MPPLGRTHHDRRSSRDKTSPRKAVWSDRSFVDHLDDEQLGQYNRRATASGVMEHQYDTRQTIDSAPSFGSGQTGPYAARRINPLGRLSSPNNHSGPDVPVCEYGKLRRPDPERKYSSEAGGGSTYDAYSSSDNTANPTFPFANTVSYGRPDPERTYGSEAGGGSTYDAYSPRGNTANPTYPSANTISCTPFNEATTYSGNIGGDNPSHGHQPSDTAFITEQFQNMHVADSATPQPHTTYTSEPLLTRPPSRQAITADSRFQIIRDGRKFFKVGRVFKVLWVEPAGSNSQDGSFVTRSIMGDRVFSKIRRFVVVREREGGACICVPLNTYGRQGASKPGVVLKDHVAVYDSTKPKPSPLPGEKLTKDPFPIIVETRGEQIDETSRINFGRVYSVEHNLRVMKIGRISTQDIPRLKEYFLEIFLSEGENGDEETAFKSAREKNVSRPISSLQSSNAYSAPREPPLSVGGYVSVSGYDSLSFNGVQYGPSGEGPSWQEATGISQPTNQMPQTFSLYPPATYTAALTSDLFQPQPPAPSSKIGPEIGYGSPIYRPQTSAYPSQAEDSPYPSPSSYQSSGRQYNNTPLASASQSKPVPYNPSTSVYDPHGHMTPSDTYQQPSGGQVTYNSTLSSHSTSSGVGNAYYPPVADDSDDGPKLPTLEEVRRRRESYTETYQKRDRRRRRHDYPTTDSPYKT